MLGFEVFAYRESAQTPGMLQDYSFATWTTAPWGLKWLDELVAAGKAEELRGMDTWMNLKWSAPAKVILPILRAGAPGNDGPAIMGEDYYIPAGWQGVTQIIEDRLVGCEDDETIIINAWDMS